MKVRLALPIVFTSILLGFASAPVDWTARAAAETDSSVAELVTHAKSAADHQKLVKWYERREDEVRNQADFYRKLALDYRDYRVTEMTTACEEIARYYDRIAEQFEKLAEAHRHRAAHAP
jgi:hypothetical protein